MQRQYTITLLLLFTRYRWCAAVTIWWLAELYGTLADELPA